MLGSLLELMQAAIFLSRLSSHSLHMVNDGLLTDVIVGHLTSTFTATEYVPLVMIVTEQVSAPYLPDTRVEFFPQQR